MLRASRYLSVGWLVVQMLWVHEGHRKQGHARNILHQLEAKAVEQQVFRYCLWACLLYCMLREGGF